MKSEELLKPDVFCPKRGERIPVWICLGSFVQGVPTCEELIEASLNISEDWANVRCEAREREMIEKLKELILTLDTYGSQGFIDAPADSGFQRKIRDWLITAGLAEPAGPPGSYFIGGAPGDDVEYLVDILTDILGVSVEELWSEAPFVGK